MIHRLQVHVGKEWCGKHCVTCVPCVAYNENEDSLVLFDGDDFFAEGHDSSLDKLDEVLGAFEIKRLARIGPTASGEGVFLHKGSDGTSLDSRMDHIPNTRTRWLKLCHWKTRDLLEHHAHVTLETDKPTLCAS